ncbi:VOC family protein [Jeongeupia naejangsanensis]|uniref:VOC family protein n=2 Tax=Jeongeupia naejangsanensis TaxID=613195 RepID=A0ABS2BJ67_9NEIS|nr:VOC family protein [Jeongeupia naejangsanensis]MBM3114874.1 VOC family protein [Jeongeupia naejangsanensis]
MANRQSNNVSLVSQWFIRHGSTEQVLSALPDYVQQVKAGEPETLIYLVNTPLPERSLDSPLQSLPPAVQPSLLFYEEYASEAAFLAHVHGPAFTGFVSEYGRYFVSSDGKPYTTVTFLHREQGFIRGLDRPAVQAGQVGSQNRHPAVMFEIIAKDQDKSKTFYSEVFGWHYESGSSGFAYVHFPRQLHALLGGIGQSEKGVAGMEPGHSFYLLVEDLQLAIERALAAGGSLHMPITSVDGYTFAMIKDPEGNPIGLLQAV